MLLEVQRLEKHIEHRRSLKVEHLEVGLGDICAIVGPIGSYKSLLVHVLAGLQSPSRGQVLIKGQDVYRQAELRKGMGVLFEEDLLYERLSVRANLDLYRNLLNLPVQSVDEALSRVSLGDQGKRIIAKVPATVQRRVAFTRALMGQPELLLLDEPTLRADFETQEMFARLIVQAAEGGVGIVVTCEDLSWAGKFCTHIVELEEGRVVESRRNSAQGGEKDVEGQEERRKVEAPVERIVPYKISARKEDRIMLYDPGDILYATSQDGKVYLHTQTDQATTNMTLQEVEQRLQGRGFFKAHRAYLVNLQHIKAVIQYTRNSYTLQLNDAKETMIPLSKQSEKELQELLGY